MPNPSELQRIEHDPVAKKAHDDEVYAKVKGVYADQGMDLVAENAFPKPVADSTEEQFKRKMAARSKLLARGASDERNECIAIIRSKVRTTVFNRLTDSEKTKNEILEEVIALIEARGPKKVEPPPAPVKEERRKR